MESQYPVTWAGKAVGEVTVTRQGLYYLFVCRAQLPAGSRCRLYACGESEPRDLGLLIPGGSGYELQTRVPAKYFEAGEYRFCMDRPAQEEFIPKVVEYIENYEKDCGEFINVVYSEECQEQQLLL